VRLCGQVVSPPLGRDVRSNPARLWLEVLTLKKDSSSSSYTDRWTGGEASWPGRLGHIKRAPHHQSRAEKRRLLSREVLWSHSFGSCRPMSVLPDSGSILVVYGR
jgi:hypothetical protein